MDQYEIESYQDLLAFVDAMDSVISEVPVPKGFGFVLSLPDEVIDKISKEMLSGFDETRRVSIVNYNDRFCVYLVSHSEESEHE